MKFLVTVLLLAGVSRAGGVGRDLFCRSRREVVAKSSTRSGRKSGLSPACAAEAATARRRPATGPARLAKPVRTWTVGGAGCDFPLIGPALTAARPGDTIVVGPGVYREDLVLSRTVLLAGKGRPHLFGTGLGTVIDVRAPGCEIRGFEIEGSGTGQTNLMDAAIHIASDGNRILHNRIERVFYGIVVEGSSHNEIIGNDVAGFEGRPFGRRGDGLYFYRSPENLVLGNTIAGMKDAIYVQYSPRCREIGNTAERSRYGLHDMFSDGQELSRNVFRNCSVGANIMNCRGNRIFANRFERNRGISSVGLSLKECDRSIVTDNEIVDNGRGLQIEGSSEDRFVSNRFRYNDTAVQLFSSAEEDVFTRNEFERNLTPVVISGGSSSTRWSENGEGNFWSGYEGFDFDGRGIGREPHSVLSAFERIEGNNPAARLFLASPAASALNFAARGFPPESDGAIDRFPLVRAASSPDRRPSAGAVILAVSALLGAAGWRRRMSA